MSWCKWWSLIFVQIHPRYRYAPRWDCGCEYSIFVALLNAKQKVIQSFTPKTVFFDQWNDQEWNQVCTKWNVIKFSNSAEPTGIFGLLIFIFQMIHVFRDYGPGVRYIHFRHGGKDTQFWAGWYGIRVTDSSVEICPAVDT